MNPALAAWIETARHVKIEDECARRGIKLKRIGAEIVGPCPKCGGQDRFAVHLKKQIFNCRGCGVGGDVIDLVKHLDDVDFNAAVTTLATGKPASPTITTRRRAPRTKSGSLEHYARQRHDTARWLWSQRKPITGTPAERYLRKARGITCPLPTTLGYLPPSANYDPTLIACFGLCTESEPGVLTPPQNVDAVHRTILRADGRGKADIDNPKRFCGSPGALPIVLAPLNDLLGLAICEGVEDALSIYEATGLGVWAAGGAGRMPALADTVPDSVEAVTIFADGDEAGQRGAIGLAERLDERRITDVHIISLHGVA
jgi:hypothetical protein